MEDGTFVFPLMAKDEAEDVCSMIIYSTYNGSIWTLFGDISLAECYHPRVTEWEGSLLMIVDCESGQRVYESRDMRQRGRRHSGHSQPCGSTHDQESLRRKPACGCPHDRDH
ncbi:trans-sialidase [Trypanosoma cruzi]|nr:trans-sialidase [Trypanosoma cruzi]